MVSDMKKHLRVGKVLVDWSQNDRHKTTIGVYSLRAREHPTVSTPVTWEEVEKTLKKKDPDLLVFEASDVLERVKKIGDLFEPVLTLKQKLPNPAGLEKAAPESSIDIAAQVEEPKTKKSIAKKKSAAGKSKKQKV